MSEQQPQTKPTIYTVRATNPTRENVSIPVGSGTLAPGATVEVSVRGRQLRQLQSSRYLEVEVLGDNSEALAAAALAREQLVASARDRLSALRATLAEALAAEKTTRDQLVALEAEERRAAAEDEEALREAARDPERSAAAVPTTAGSRSEEIRGLRFDLWAAEVRRLDAEAAVLDAESIVAADEQVRRRARVRAAEEAVREAQAALEAVNQEAASAFDRPDTLAQRARALRARRDRLEAGGPEARVLGPVA